MARSSRKVGKIASALQCGIYDIDPEFSEVEVVSYASPPSDEAANLIAAVASRMALKLGFQPTDTQVIRHLLATSPYHDIAK